MAYTGENKRPIIRLRLSLQYYLPKGFDEKKRKLESLAVEIHFFTYHQTRTVTTRTISKFINPLIAAAAAPPAVPAAAAAVDPAAAAAVDPAAAAAVDPAAAAAPAAADPAAVPAADADALAADEAVVPAVAAVPAQAAVVPGVLAEVLYYLGPPDTQ